MVSAITEESRYRQGTDKTLNDTHMDTLALT